MTNSKAPKQSDDNRQTGQQESQMFIYYFAIVTI